jgi:hypothetical protein
MGGNSLLKFARNIFLHCFHGRALFTQARMQTGHATLSQSARHDQIERGKIWIHIQGKSVHAHPSTHAHTHGAYF